MKRTVSAYFKVIPKECPDDYYYMEYKVEFGVNPGYEDYPLGVPYDDKTTQLIIKEIRKTSMFDDCDIVRVTKEEHDANVELDDEENYDNDEDN